MNNKKTKPMSSTTHPERNEFLDITKGVLMLLVVWGHVIQVIAYGDGSYFEDPIFKAIYTFHMPLFMAISGYVSYGSIQRHAWLPMVTRRFNQLIVPAFVWAAIFGVIVSATAVMFQGADVRHTWVHLPMLVFKTASSFWFLWAIFFFTVIIATLKTVRCDTVAFMTAVFFFYLLVPALGKDYLFKFTLPFFCVGYIVARAGVPALVMKSSAGIAAMVASVVFYLLWNRQDYIYVSQMCLSLENLPHIVFRMACGIVISFAVLRGLFTVFAKPPLRIFSVIGKRSLEIYILHTIVLKVVPAMAQPLDPVVFASTAAPMLALTFCLLCSIGNGFPFGKTLNFRMVH
jgi:fucose 4-O-acetylase-like acetyltransferase